LLWPVTVNALPVTFNADNWTVAELVFFSESVAVALLPTATDPKLTLLAEGSRLPLLAP
jgi:hypothetical protein